MDEGRNMVLLFPTTLKLDLPELREEFQPEYVVFQSEVVFADIVPRCHIFYNHRVVDIPDGKPKWKGLDDKSERLDEP